MVGWNGYSSYMVWLCYSLWNVDDDVVLIRALHFYVRKGRRDRMSSRVGKKCWK